MEKWRVNTKIAITSNWWKQDSDSEDDSVIELEESLLIPPDIAVCDDCIKRITAEREYEQSHFVKKTLHVEVHDIRGRGRASTSSRRTIGTSKTGDIAFLPLSRAASTPRNPPG